MFKNEQLTEEMLGLEKFAFKLTANKHDADDLLQSTILRAIEKKHLFQEGTDLFKWSSKIMYNLFVSNYRRKVKYETKNDPEDYISKQYVEAPQDSQIELMQVKEAIEQLSEEHKEILILVCIQGMRYQDVSAKLKVPVGTVRSRLSRARHQLSVCMDDHTDKARNTRLSLNKVKTEDRSSL